MQRTFVRASAARFLWISIVAAAFALAAIPHASAQDGSLLRGESDDEARLRAWMAVRASRSPDLGWIAAVTIPIGVGAAATGIAFAAEHEHIAPERNISLASAAIVGLGVLELGLSIALTVLPNLPRDDLRRIPTRRLTERELGRLEGVLRQDAELAHVARVVSLWGGAGAALGGAAIMPLLAAYPPQGGLDTALGWGVAAGLALGGVIAFAISLFESPPEADYREYRRGLMPSEVPTIALHARPDGFAITF